MGSQVRPQDLSWYVALVDGIFRALVKRVGVRFKAVGALGEMGHLGMFPTIAIGVANLHLLSKRILKERWALDTDTQGYIL